MSELPKISVVTPSFNSIHTIRETIESVRSQNYPQVEHIVMDGGSTDGTLDLLKEYPHLIWVSEKDEGHYHAMNKGILRATGAVVNILNADDCHRPQTLRLVGEAFAQHPEWDALFGDVIYVDAENREIFRRAEAKYDYQVLRCSGVCYVQHPTLFVRRALHDRLGLYRHKEFKNCCDWAFILAMGQAGCRVGHIPEYLINYRYHQFGQSADRRITANMRREDAIIRQEHGIPGGVTGKTLRFLYRGKRQFQKLLYRGQMDCIPGTWKLRRHLQDKTTFSSNIGLDKL
ncbi:MAG TPA: glycosyltransferase family 2 protein [Dongiaceae bacterium]|jgi:glycosyltransferase involved in cell wall biosynthesis|nr:glycosyltransferase family 2 protein [Dongiaceae bacterium]